MDAARKRQRILAFSLAERFNRFVVTDCFRRRRVKF
jgi:hypothetical protein